MASSASKQKEVPSAGKSKGSTNATKGWVEILEEEPQGEADVNGGEAEIRSGENEPEWCIVHLYREDEELKMGPARNTRSNTGIVEAATNSISTPPKPSSSSSQRKDHAAITSSPKAPATDESSILCIPSVPSHITPSDFLSWVGPDTTSKVSHFRMVMTGQSSRYLVLLKFRESSDARWWRKLWDGRRFDKGGVDEETASVLAVRRVVFETPAANITKEILHGKDNENGSKRSYTSSSERSFPDMTHDPFTPSQIPTSSPLNISGNGNGTNSALSELPTCPVCLERMEIDSSDPTTNSLLTILCQHVFHCACLQKWRGSGCPVCRHTQNKIVPLRAGLQGRAPFGRNPGEAEACSVCGCEEDLWICLVCGNVGCGRYKGGHAKRHWMDSQQVDDSEGRDNVVGGHNYALEIETQHVWDYVGDKWVHRLIMDQGDGKLEYSSSNTHPSTEGEEEDRNHDRGSHTEIDTIPREKLEKIGLEYTHLLTSSLDSQRLYFEDLLSKARATTSTIPLLESRLTSSQSHIQTLESELALLRTTTIPQLERDLSRANTRAEKTSDVARNMSKAWSEEKEVSKGLMERVQFLNEKLEGVERELEGRKRENEELREENRDLGFFISGGERVRGLGEEVREGVVSVPMPPPTTPGKGKGKGRKK